MLGRVRQPAADGDRPVRGTRHPMAEPERHEDTPNEVVGHFATPEGARAALVRIEGLGIDADRIVLHVDGTTVPTKEGLRHADAAATGDVATTAGIAAGLGAVAGAAAGVVGGIV